MDKNPDAKSAFSQLYAARDVSNMLLSGNYKLQQAAIDKLKLLSIGVTRLGPDVIGSMDPQKFTDIVKEVISKKTTNGLPPEELNMLHEGARLVEANAIQTLDQSGTLYANQHANVFGINPDVIKNTFLFPKSALNPSIPETRVAINPDTQKVGFFKISNGKAKLVQRKE